MGYQQSTVNHQQHYVDPATRAHTQAIERAWLDAKMMILKRIQGVSCQLFQSHLDHFSWKEMRKNSNDLIVFALAVVFIINLIVSFLEDVQDVYH